MSIAFADTFKSVSISRENGALPHFPGERRNAQDNLSNDGKSEEKQRGEWGSGRAWQALFLLAFPILARDGGVVNLSLREGVVYLMRNPG
jgi:hypothetical protein